VTWPLLVIFVVSSMPYFFGRGKDWQTLNSTPLPHPYFSVLM
jgi:hypothetical protein